MRKDIFERMRFFVREDIKPNFSQIARQYGVDRRTAKTLYDKAGQVKEVVRKKRNIHGKLDDFKEIVKLKYEAGCTAMAIHRFIQKKGYTGGYTFGTVRDLKCLRNDFRRVIQRLMILISSQT